MSCDIDGNTPAHLALFDGKPWDDLPGLGIENRYGLTPEATALYLTKRVRHGKDIPFYSTQNKTLEKLPYASFRRRFQVDWADRLIFSDPKILRWTLNQSLRRLSEGDIEAANHWTAALFSEALRTARTAPCYLKWINPLIGYGLFAGKSLPDLTLIGEYTGIVRKRRRFKDRRNDYIFGYVIGPYDTPYVIDADSWGNLTRFINHSNTPNLVSKWLIHEGTGHIIFYTKRPIAQHEQLTYDYGPLYWKQRSAPLELN